MHEYSIVQALLERVQAEAEAHGARTVTRLWLDVGELSGVESDLLLSAYETFRERTICERASLELRRVPARWECRRCKTAIEPGAVLRCLRCGVPAVLCSGDELVLERIEMEVA